MTLTLELPHDVEDRLREQADAQGLDLAAFVQQLLVQNAAKSEAALPAQEISPAEFRRRLRAFIEGNAGIPSLPEEALERASFYGDRG